MNIFETSSKLMDEHLSSISDEEFLKQYSLCETNTEPTITEFLDATNIN